MTLGAAFTGKSHKLMVVLTDSQVTGETKSNSGNKMSEFDREGYHGAIFGAGVVDYIMGVIQNMEEIKAETLDDFVKQTHIRYSKLCDQNEKFAYAQIEKEARQTAKPFAPSKKIPEIKAAAKKLGKGMGDSYLEQQVILASQKHDQVYAEMINKGTAEYDEVKKVIEKTDFLLVAYDEKMGKTRKFVMTRVGYMEKFFDHDETGSGSKEADSYFSKALEGKQNGRSMTLPELVFHTMTAYQHATVDPYVGGTPNLVAINEQRNEKFTVRQINALANVCGAKIADYNDKVLTRKKAMEYVTRIIAKDPKVFGEVGKTLGLPDKLTKVIIPLSAWYGMVN